MVRYANKLSLLMRRFFIFFWREEREGYVYTRGGARGNNVARARD